MEKCIICNSDLSFFHKGTRDDDTVDVLKCCKCGNMQLSSFDHITKQMYKDGEMRKNQYNATVDSYADQDWLLWIEETRTDDDRRFLALKELCRGKAVCDFGCGNGGFLRRIKEVAAKAEGVELDAYSREHLSVEGIEVHESFEAARKYDVITMFQVIEHLVDPWIELAEIKSHLNAGGVLIVETPNAEDALISLYELEAFKNFTFWSEHVVLYNNQSLQKLLSDIGFTDVVKGQIQRYPLANHLYWLKAGKPGGHVKWDFLTDKALDEEYSKKLVERNIADTLWFRAIN